MSEGFLAGLAVGMIVTSGYLLCTRALPALGRRFLDWPAPLEPGLARAAELAETLALQALDSYEAERQRAPWPGYFDPDAMRARALERVAIAAQRLTDARATRRDDGAVLVPDGRLFDALTVAVHRLLTDAPPPQGGQT